MSESTARAIMECTMESRAASLGLRYGDFDREIVMRHARPFFNAKSEKLIEALEKGFMEIEGMTNKPDGMAD